MKQQVDETEAELERMSKQSLNGTSAQYRPFSSVCLPCLFQPGGDPVTRVKLKESIDHILAVGSSSGDVCIFQLPSGVPGKSRQVAQFLIQSFVLCVLYFAVFLCLNANCCGFSVTRNFTGIRTFMMWTHKATATVKLPPLSTPKYT